MQPQTLSHKPIYFSHMLVAALVLHGIAVIGLYYAPGLRVNQIPVHVLNIKLGVSELEMAENGTQTLVSLPTNIDDGSAAVNKEAKPPFLNKRPQPAPEKKATPKPRKAPAKQADQRSSAVSVSETTDEQQVNEAAYSGGAKQHVRAGGVEGGSANGTEETVRRYEQMISLWVQRKRNYLDGLMPAGVKRKMMVRLRIDRSGNIIFAQLERSSGYAALDQAVVNMVKASNPVPAVPSDYPKGNVLEFLVPINYTSR